MAAYTPFGQTTQHIALNAQGLIGRAEAMIQLQALQSGQVLVVHGAAGVGKTAVLDHYVRGVDRARVIDSQGLQSVEQWLVASARALNSPLQPAPDDWASTTSDQLKLVLKRDRIDVLVVDHAQHLLKDILPVLEEWAFEADIPVLVGSRWLPASYDGPVLTLSPWPVEGDGPDFWSSHPVVQILERYAQGVDVTSMHRLLWQIAPYTQGLALSCELLGARLKLFSAEALLGRLEAGRSSTVTRTLSVALESSWEALDATQRHVMAIAAQWIVPPSLDLIEASVALGEGVEDVDVVDVLDTLKRHALLEIQRQGAHVHIHVMPGVRDLVALQPEATLARRLAIAALAQLCEDLYLLAKGIMWQPQSQPLRPLRHDIEVAYAWVAKRLTESQTQGDSLRAQRALGTALAQLTLGLGIVIRHDGDFPSSRALWITREALDLDDLCPPALRDWMDVLWFDSAHAAPVLEGYQRLIDAMERAGARGDDVTELGCCVRLAQSLFLSTDDVVERLDEINARGLELADTLKDNHSKHRILSGHGIHAARQHDMVRAIALSKESAELAHHIEDWRGEAKSLLTMGFCHQTMGQREVVADLMQRAVEGFERAHDLLGLAHTLENIAWMSIDEGRVKQAQEATTRLGALSMRLGLKWLFGVVSTLKGQIALEDERYMDAIIDFERASSDLHGGPRQPILAASSYLQSLAYLFNDDPERAHTSFKRAFSFFDAMDNFEVRARLLSAKAFWKTREGKIRQATQLLNEAAEYQREQNPIIEHTIAAHRCLVDLTQMNRAFEAQKMRVARKHQTQLLSTMSGLLRSPTDDPLKAPIYRDVCLRMSFRILQHMLPDWLRNMLAIELQDPDATALLMDRERRTFRPPGQSQWVDMSARATPFALLDALVQRRIEAPGEPIDSMDLYARVWIGEDVGVESSTNRLYVTIATLRRAGLKTLIVSERGGYMLDQEVELIFVDNQGEEDLSRQALV